MIRKEWLRSAIVASVAMLFLTPARASSITSPYLTGPSDPSQMNATVNGLVVAINNILSPLTGGGAVTGSSVPSAATVVNAISMTPAVSGSLASVGLQSGADANAGIQISPNGSGNVVLFGAGDTGVLQIANASGWYPAKGGGVVPCPGGGAGPSSATSGLLQASGQTIAGYFVNEDWLGRPYWIPGCR